MKVRDVRNKVISNQESHQNPIVNDIFNVVLKIDQSRLELRELMIQIVSQKR